MSDDRWTKERDDDANGADYRAPYIDRGPRLPRLPKVPAPTVSADEIFGWLEGTYEKRLGIVRRDPKPEKGAPPAQAAPDLTRARALAIEYPFTAEQCERVLIVARRDEELAHELLRAACAMGGPDPIGEVCFGVAQFRKRTR